MFLDSDIDRIIARDNTRRIKIDSRPNKSPVRKALLSALQDIMYAKGVNHGSLVANEVASKLLKNKRIKISLK